MFTEAILKENSKLLDVATKLHQNGEIFPDTYVIDLEQLGINTKNFSEKADQLGLEAFYMTKQLGRNPEVAKRIVESGLEKAVVVDYREAEVLMDNGLKIGHIGNLVQVPQTFLERVIRYGVDYISVFSIEKLKLINKISKENGITQKILLRVVDEGDNVYPGQTAGFNISELPKLAKEILQLENISVKGCTSFPCILFDEKEDKFTPTHNADTVIKATQILNDNGINATELNMPSATCYESLDLLKEMGATQVEPGHGLSGSTPMNAAKEMNGKISYCYVSEVSHNFEGKAYAYGGGYYRRGLLKTGLIPEKNRYRKVKMNKIDSTNIDYYLEIDQEEDVGETVLMSFRTQIFVTRSNVAIVDGIQSGNPRLVGIYDSQGKKLKGGIL
ncbi:alanine racemase [Lactobacillus sp. YT155]|uniref:alanine racemase n=1 Tax=Lactobacillus sp. YT155 TaxID=3060955 RepID=UPI00265EBD4D|nr:alanine racemase [Lactobacillus sp. YT155]MDO1604948.1 alanine racemase [Lactobacillus sp. YT155]